MKRIRLWMLVVAIPLAMLLALGWATTALADWRWAPPKVKKERVSYSCSTMKCFDQVIAKERKKLKRKIQAHNARRLREWKKWTGMYIPPCTWYGESGLGPEYSPARYVMPNSTGSGAYGKFQFMPGTYFNRGKYKDWSALDQEIAARREYWANGTQPWANC